MNCHGIEIYSLHCFNKLRILGMIFGISVRSSHSTDRYAPRVLRDVDEQRAVKLTMPQRGAQEMLLLA
jgi:hypothetical protein